MSIIRWYILFYKLSNHANSFHAGKINYKELETQAREYSQPLSISLTALPTQ